MKPTLQRAVTLHRAVAYLLHSAATPTNARQPECTVFFEVPVGIDPGSHLRTLLSQAWCCPADEVDFYNLWSEAELLAQSGLPASAGDVRLLESGWSHGPLFCCPQRTLMLVRPLTQLRLVDARCRARRLQVQQLAAEGIALGGHMAHARRHTDVAARAAYQAMQDMGGHC